jgi:hypothetical protein
MAIILLMAAGLVAQEVPATSGASEPTGASSSTPKGKSDYVDLEAGVGYSTNPFLSFYSGAGRAFARASFRAVHNRWTERTTTTLAAYGENIAYLGRYGSQQLFSLSAHYDRLVSQTVKLFGDLDGSLDRNGQLGTRFISLPLIAPVGGVPTPSLPGASYLDVLANGPTYGLSGQGGAQVTSSPREVWTFRSGYSRTMFRGTALDRTYSDFFGSAAYDRKIDQRTTFGGILTARQSLYDGPGNVRVITPQVTVRKSLSPQTDFTAALGVSFARIDDGVTVHRSTGLAANGSLCHSGQSDRICASVSRDQQVSSIIGPVTSLGANVDYVRKIDANQSLQLTVGASRSSRPFTTLIAPLSTSRSDYVTAAGSYSRRLGNRWFTGVNVSYRKLYQAGPDPKADVGGSFFVRYRLGDVG